MMTLYIRSYMLLVKIVIIVHIIIRLQVIGQFCYQVCTKKHFFVAQTSNNYFLKLGGGGIYKFSDLSEQYFSKNTSSLRNYDR